LSSGSTPDHPAASAVADQEPTDLGRRHLRFGWWSLLAFLTLGIVLEGLHGLKSGWYLDVPNETRRLMWTLAHAHGTLISLINIVYGITAWTAPGPGADLAGASRFLLAANILLPMGFFFGGLFFHDGDPGLGILLVPVGAVALFLGVLLAARASSKAQRPEKPKAGGRKRSSRR
jgi:hypothetical protein